MNQLPVVIVHFQTKDKILILLKMLKHTGITIMKQLAMISCSSPMKNMVRTLKHGKGIIPFIDV